MAGESFFTWFEDLDFFEELPSAKSSSGREK